MICRIRPDGTILRIGASSSFGRACLDGVEDPVGQDLAALLPDGAGRVVEELVAAVLEGGSAPTAARELVKVENGARCLEILVHSELGPDGVVAEDLHVVVRDVTGRVAAEAAERLREHWFQELAQNLRDGFAAVDAEGRIVESNRAFRRLTGYTAEELAGLTYRDLTPAKWHDEEEAILRDQVEVRGYSELYQKEYLRPDGTTVPIEIRTYLRRGPAGEPLGMWAFVRDISERIRTEDELHRSSQMLQLVLDHIPQRVFWKDRDFRYLGCNRPFAQDAALADPAEIVGRDDFELSWRETAPLYRADDRRVMENDAARVNFEEPQSRPDGSKLWLRTSKVPLHDREGGVIGVLGTYEDITERKRAEEAIHASEERNRELLEYLSTVMQSVADAIFTVRMPEREIEFVNSSVERIFGYSEQELRGRSTRCLYADADGFEAFAGKVREAVEEGRSYVRTDEELVRKDGSRLWTEVHTALLYAEGELVRTISAVRDVTERRRMEAALLHSEATNRAIFAALPDLIFVVARDGRFLDYLSGDSSKLLAPPDRFLGRSPDEVLPPEIASLHREKVASVLATGQVEAYEYGMAIGDADLLFEARMVPFGADSALAIVRDVTEHRQMEQQLTRAQRLEAVGRLAGGAAHDFNNLLQAMLSQAQMLHVASGDAGQLAEIASEQEHLIQRAAALTRQLLLFSRRETARPERLELNELVRGASSMLERLVRENILLELDLAPLELPVVADHGQLEQVLVNLVVNACDAMPDGGRLTIATSRSAEGWISLSVEDTGHGIPTRVIDRIFDPFFSTKSAETGTGLGLAVVHGIVTRHGGRVEVASRERVGSTFTVMLPMAPSEGPSDRGDGRAVAEELPRGQGEIVLLVEDEAEARRALERMLRMLGYEVVAVGSGSEARRLAPELAFRVLLTDLMLPDVSGAQLAPELVERWPEMGVVLMSGYAADDDLRRHVAEGELRYLQKPFTMAALAVELRACLGDRG